MWKGCNLKWDDWDDWDGNKWSEKGKATNGQVNQCATVIDFLCYLWWWWWVFEGLLGHVLRIALVEGDVKVLFHWEVCMYFMWLGRIESKCRSRFYKETKNKWKLDRAVDFGEFLSYDCSGECCLPVWRIYCTKPRRSMYKPVAKAHIPSWSN